MSRTEIVNIVKKITQLSQRDKADLVRILEEALEGGGGGDTSKFISVEPQDLTEEQKMQARKNQGLYYEGVGIGEKTIINPSPEYDWEYPDSNFDYEYTTFKWFIGDAPTQSEILGIRYDDYSPYIPGNSLQSAVVDGSDGKAIMYAEDMLDSSRRMFMVVSEDVSFGGSNHKKGIYFPDMPTDPYLYEIKYMGETTIFYCIEPKYIKDMYYEETTESEKTVLTPDTPEYNWKYPDNYWSYDGVDFGWVSADTPTQEDIVSIRFTDSEDYIQGSELSSTIIEPDQTSGGPIILYEVNDSDSARKKFFVVTNDASLGGYELKKGIYVPNLLLFADPYISEINYNGTTTIIHQVPQKYLPSGGLQTYDINMDWSDIDEIISQGYGYGHIVFDENDYNKLCEALANGKMIALNIGRGSYGYPGGKLLTGNYLPLNRENNDGYISEIIFPVIDWPTYNPNTGTITGSRSYSISLKCGYGVESEEFKYEFVASVVNP